MGLVQYSSIIIILTFLSYIIFSKLRLPAPAIMGPMIFIGVFQVLGGGLTQLPSFFMDSFQIIIGLSVGAKINRSNLGDIKRIWVPSLIVAVYTLASTALMTLLIQRFTSDYPTALFSAAPGGITEMAVMAIAYKAEIPIVSTFQFVRLLVILGIIPFVARIFKEKTTSPDVLDKPDLSDNVSKSRLGLKQFLHYTAGIAGGIILIILGFPGGGIIGGMAALGTANIISGEAYLFPKKIMKIALLGIGVTIGLEFSPLMVSKIQEMFLPILIFSLIIVLGNLLIGWLIRYITKWDTITCLLGSAPGGLSQMLVVGEEMEADTLKISILQSVRVLTIITSIPIFAAMIV